jgi:hypothetical protein
MKRKTQIGIVALCLVIALLAPGAAAAGLFLRGDGAFKPVTSVRGGEAPRAIC